MESYQIRKNAFLFENIFLLLVLKAFYEKLIEVLLFIEQVSEKVAKPMMTPCHAKSLESLLLGILIAIFQFIGCIIK